MAILKFAVLSLGLLMITAQAKSEDMPLYAEVGYWDVRVDTTLDNGCFLMTIYEGDSVLRMGFNQTEGNVYMLVSDPSWNSLEAGKKYEMQIEFGNAGKWNGDATAVTLGDAETPFLWFDLVGSKVGGFIDEFMREHNVKFFYKSKQILALKLTGSYKAGLKLAECQELMNKKSPAEEDPFSSTPSNTDDSDPFAI
jgi:hypothetical protein